MLSAAGAAIRVGGSHSAESAPARPRVLLIRPDHAGDLVLTSPAVETLRTALPNAHLTMMVGPWSADVARRDPLVDEVLECPFPGFTRADGGSIIDPYRLLWTAAASLKAASFDAALVLRFDHWWGAWLAALAGIPVRVGHGVAECRPFLTYAIEPLAGEHWVRRSTRVVGGLLDAWRVSGTEPAAELALRFGVREQDEADARGLLDRLDVGAEQRVVVMHPGSGAALKLWPVDSWIELGAALAARGARVLVTGSAAEEGTCERIARGVPGAVTLAAQTELGPLAALFKLCDLVVGVDSGPLHLAVAAGTPSVHLFGPTDPAVYGPWGDPARHVVVTAGWPGVPCGRLDLRPRDGESPACMRAISVERVETACRNLLAGDSPRATVPSPRGRIPRGSTAPEASS